MADQPPEAVSERSTEAKLAIEAVEALDRIAQHHARQAVEDSRSVAEMVTDYTTLEAENRVLVAMLERIERAMTEEEWGDDFEIEVQTAVKDARLSLPPQEPVDG